MAKTSIFDHSARSRLQLEAAIRASETAASLSDNDATGVLNYARHLQSVNFAKELNRGKAGTDLPLSYAPVWLGGNGPKDLFAQISSEIGRGLENVLLVPRQIDAVKAAILERPRKRASRAAAPRVKRATVTISRVEKFLSAGKRTIRGLANSGQVDRMADIVDPKGGSWTLPTPLLWQHDAKSPIGWVRQIEARSDGLWITAELAEGVGFADEAWKMIEAGLVDSYSIGFSVHEWEPLPNGGQRFTKWSLLEISVVTIPADPAAKIQRAARSHAAPGGSARILRAP